MNGLMLAQLAGVEPPNISPAIWDMLYVGGVAVGLAVVIFVTVAVTRDRRQKRHRSRRGPEILKNSDEYLREKSDAVAGGQSESESRELRRRRKRRDHRPRNPTLAEAGGLPPERDPDSAPHTGL